MRPLPRHIDRPNRTVEYLAGFLAGFYLGFIFLDSDFMGYMLGVFSIYIMYKITKDKPEGMVVRFFYKITPVKMKFFVPNPKLAPKFHI